MTHNGGPDRNRWYGGSNGGGEQCAWNSRSCSGRNIRHGDHNYLIDKAGNPMVVCAYPGLSPELDIIDRLLDLAAPPALEALSPLRKARLSPPPIPVLIALPEDRPGRPAHLAGAFGNRLASSIFEGGQDQRIDVLSLGERRWSVLHGKGTVDHRQRQEPNLSRGRRRHLSHG